MTAGLLLRRYRRMAGLTQEALAARAGYSTVYVGMIERGTARPLPDTIQLLGAALALSPEDRAALEAAVGAPHTQAIPAQAAPSQAPPQRPVWEGRAPPACRRTSRPWSGVSARWRRSPRCWGVRTRGCSR